MAFLLLGEHHDAWKSEEKSDLTNKREAKQCHTLSRLDSTIYLHPRVTTTASEDDEDKWENVRLSAADDSDKGVDNDPGPRSASKDVGLDIVFRTRSLIVDFNTGRLVSVDKQLYDCLPMIGASTQLSHLSLALACMLSLLQLVLRTTW